MLHRKYVTELLACSRNTGQTNKLTYLGVGRRHSAVSCASKSSDWIWHDVTAEADRAV